jgi:UDP-N-acetylmuramoyl-L-alanyl-D-glutamate--2,6-diaminopimelate ligase
MIKKLQDILSHLSDYQLFGSSEVSVSGITIDSRAVKEGFLFIAQKGTVTNGHQFIENAIKSGANIIVCEELPKNTTKDITYVKVKDSQIATAHIAASFYDFPSSKMQLVGITGTNGKTTLATLSYNLFTGLGYPSGLISTVQIKIKDKTIPATHTTPDAITLNKLLAEMVNEGVTHCFMEVSSHGIHQHRTSGIMFAGGVFTNLTHDHLDYHKTFAEYRDVKKSFFDSLAKEAFALVNIDDKNGSVMVQNTSAQVKAYALKTLADYKAKILENSIQGLLLQIDNQEVWTQLIGSFNAYNLLAIYAISQELAIDKIEALQELSILQSVAGRFQYFISDNGTTTIIDYAHTPDALNNVLSTIQDINTGKGSIITVVGCGGDRDKSKRPKMAHIASHRSSTAIFTSDNPRSEDPQAIINDMEAGVTPENSSKTLSILDRKEAIKTAHKLSKKGDIVLIAGKGHETYQEIKGVKYDFDDFKIAKDIFNTPKTVNP